VTEGSLTVQRLSIDQPSLESFLTDLARRNELGNIGDMPAYAQKLMANAVLFGACDNRNIVALCALYCNRPEQDFAFIPQINVCPEYRNKGLASAMLQECTDYARGNGFAELRLFVNKDNLPAQALYAKRRFVRAGETDRQYECVLKLR